MRANFLTKLKQALIAIAAGTILSMPVFADSFIPVASQPQQSTFIPSAPTIDARAYILMDALSGRILAEKNADDRVPPASLTKVMTLYIVSEAIKEGRIHMDDKVRVSTKAWKAEGSRMFIKVGDEIPVKDLMMGLIVASGNDAAIALAEHVAGTEEGFTDLMNQEARQLGMTNTHFTDSTGLPDPEHYSTARDFALLTQAYIKNYPEDYNLHAEKWFTHNGIKQPNRNRLLWRYQFADGLKTGHTDEAGYCLISSAKKDGMRLVSVVMGEPSDGARTEDSIRLLNFGFRFFDTHKLYDGGSSLTKARVWQGEHAEIPLGITQDLYVTIPKGQYKRLRASVTLNNALKAPIEQGEILSTLNITLNNQIVSSTPLVSLKSDPRGGWFRRTTDSIGYTLHKLFSSPKEQLNTG